jgi:hypothetical protein
MRGREVQVDEVGPLVEEEARHQDVHLGLAAVVVPQASSRAPAPATSCIAAIAAAPALEPVAGEDRLFGLQPGWAKRWRIRAHIRSATSGCG